jgi:hypothetical protein
MVNKATTSKNLATAINLAIDQKTSSLRVATFAIITQVNDNQTINAQPVTSQLVNNPHGAKRYVNLPEIQQIPYLLVSEPKAGDYCVLLHLDNPIKTQQYSGNYIPDKYIQIQINFLDNIAQSGTSGFGIISCNVFNLQGEQTAQLLSSVAYANVNNYVSFTQEFSKSNTNGIEFTIENFQISGIPNVETLQLSLSITIPDYNNNKPISVKVPYLSVSGSTYTFQTTSQRVISTTSVKSVKDSARKHELDNCIALCGFKNLSANLELTEQDEEQAEQYDFKKYYENNIAEIAKTISDTLYPVGHIFLTNNSAYNPNGKLSGTWERLSSSAYLRLLNGSAVSDSERVPEITGSLMDGLGNTTWSGNAVTGALPALKRVFQLGYRRIYGINYPAGSSSFYINPAYVSNVSITNTSITVTSDTLNYGVGIIIPIGYLTKYRLSWVTSLSQEDAMRVTVTYMDAGFDSLGSYTYTLAAGGDLHINSTGTNRSIDMTYTSRFPRTAMLLISFSTTVNNPVSYTNISIRKFYTAGEFDGGDYIWHDTTSAGANVFMGTANPNSFAFGRKNMSWLAQSGEVSPFESPTTMSSVITQVASLNGHISAGVMSPRAYNAYAWIRTE